MALSEDLVEAWDINQRIDLYLLDAIPEEDLVAKPEKGKSVRGQFCHLHLVRMMWIKSAAPSVLGGLSKLDADSATKDDIRAGLVSSSAAIAQMVSESLEAGRGVKGFKPTAAAFVAYLIAHEAHHRGMIELALRQSGKPISDKVSYGLWEWGTR